MSSNQISLFHHVISWDCYRIWCWIYYCKNYWITQVIWNIVFL